MERSPRGYGEAIGTDDEVAAHFSAGSETAAMLRFWTELAGAQASLGSIPGEAAIAIRQAAGAFRPDETTIRIATVRDGVPVPALLAALRQAVGEPHAAHLHAGATSQDAVDTALMLRLRDVFQLFVARLAPLLARLETLGRTEGDRPLMAQTRMQAALPFTVASKIETWRRPLAALGDRLSALASRQPIQLGGPVGDGASFGLPYRALRTALAERLGLADAEPWHSDRTVVLDSAQSIALLAGTLGKIGQDVALLAQSDRRAVLLSGAGTSSAMAHKHNPVGAEVLVALARLNAGLLGTLAQSMVHENERSGAAWTLEWLLLPRIAETSGASLLHARTLLDGLRFAGPAENERSATA